MSEVHAPPNRCMPPPMGNPGSTTVRIVSFGVSLEINVSLEHGFVMEIMTVATGVMKIHVRVSERYNKWE